MKLNLSQKRSYVMSNSEPNTIIIDDSIFYELEEMFEEKLKELEEE